MSLSLCLSVSAMLYVLYVLHVPKVKFWVRWDFFFCIVRLSTLLLFLSFSSSFITSHSFPQKLHTPQFTHSRTFVPHSCKHTPHTLSRTQQPTFLTLLPNTIYHHHHVLNSAYQPLSTPPMDNNNTQNMPILCANSCGFYG